MLYAIILHSLAGAVTGSVFKIRTLVLLLLFVVIGVLILTAAGVHVTIVWTLANLAAMQLGYFAGLLARLTIEWAGYSIPPAKIRGSQ